MALGLIRSAIPGFIQTQDCPWRAAHHAGEEAVVENHGQVKDAPNGGQATMCVTRGVPLCRSFVSVVHKPPCPCWIYYGSANATLIQMCKTMLGVMFCDIAATCGLQSNHKAFSHKTAAKGAATQQE